MFQRIAGNPAKSGLERVMGYHRPVSEFNKGKQAEFKTRVAFIESKAMSHVEENI